jgi:ABC-type transport system substrate-binding protein
LLSLDQHGPIVGDGAARWTISADELTYTFAIRACLTWADGTPITARDFADAIARSQDPCIRKGHPAFTDQRSPTTTWAGKSTSCWWGRTPKKPCCALKVQTTSSSPG